MEAIQKRIGAEMLGSRFFVFMLVGASIMLISGLAPAFWISIGLGVVTLNCGLLWDFLRSKRARTILAWLALVCGLIGLVNVVTHGVIQGPPVSGHFLVPFEEVYTALIAGTFGPANVEALGHAMGYAGMPALQFMGLGVGHIIIVLGSLQGILASRMME